MSPMIYTLVRKTTSREANVGIGLPSAFQAFDMASFFLNFVEEEGQSAKEDKMYTMSATLYL